MSSPNVENYTLGNGVVYFNRKNLTTGLWTGERDLGNAPSFSFNVSLEKLEHFSSRGGLRAKDKQVILFQNKRGYAPYIICETCGWIPHCKQCDVSLTLHKAKNLLSCHYCGAMYP